MKEKKYILTAEFWRQILWMVLISVAAVALILWSLKLFTRHGKEIIVGDICGLKTGQLESYTEQFGFKFEVRDSVYQPGVEPGTVLGQSPVPGSKIKKNRTFYLVVAAKNPSSQHMPDLRDLSLRQATSLLETYGLKVGRVIEVPQVVKGSVVRQLYKGAEIAPGSSVMQGEYIDLEVGNGKPPVVVIPDEEEDNYDEEE